MLTVHRGGIEKYIEAARKLVQKYGLNKYYDQRLSLVEAEIVSLFESGKDNRQTHLSNYMGP
jgi:DNA polymerase II large subunit